MPTTTPWYKTGQITIDTAAGTITVAGTAYDKNRVVVGTGGMDWVANVQPRQQINMPDNKGYEIESVPVANIIILARPYGGSSVVSPADYDIVPIPSTIRDLVGQVATLVNEYAEVKANAGQGKFGDGTVEAPGIRYVADEDTGWRRTASGTQRAVANGIDVLETGPNGASLLSPDGAKSLAVTNSGTTVTGPLTAGATSVTTLSASGNVSITMASPLLALQATGATSSKLRLDALSDNGYGASIDFRSKTTGGVQNGWTVGTNLTGGTNALEFYDGTATRMALPIGGGATFSGALSVGGASISAWDPALAVVEFPGAVWVGESNGGAQAYVGCNTYYDGTWRYKTANPACQLRLNNDGSLDYYQAIVSPAAGGPVNGTGSFNRPWGVDVNGNAIVGLANATGCHSIYKSPTEGTQILGVRNIFGTEFFEGGAYGANSAACVQVVHKNTSTGRSINAAGTINAAGADYAEYEHKAGTCGAVGKGQIVGRDAAGMLTDRWSEAISYGIKSTDPNLVGGDRWGTEDVIGQRPPRPIYEAPAYGGAPDPGPAPVSPVLALPMATARQPDESDDTFAVRLAAWQDACAHAEAALISYESDLAAHQAAAAAWQHDHDDYDVAVGLAETAHAAAMAMYERDLATFEAKLEGERQRVDRIAYAGKVPVNVIGAAAGDYIVAAEGPDNLIIGQVVTKAEMAANMSRYLDAVGRVHRILDDGRAEVAVITH